MTDKIVKNLNFGEDAKIKIFEGINKLTKAVSSTLGASGQCVILEDSNGRPIITKDGVTVADSITLLDPVENMGATLLKEAARKTVKEAGDGTTTATVLAHSILSKAYEVSKTGNIREIKNGINTGVEKVIKYLEDKSIEVSGDMLMDIATISCNNDRELGEIIGNAFKAAGENGVVVMEPTDTEETTFELVDGVQYEKGITNSHFVTSKEKRVAELDNPLVLIVESPVESIRQIQSVLEYVIANNKQLLIIGDLDQKITSTLAMNKVKGNIKVNVIDAPTYGVNKKDVLSDLAVLTGATIINEDLGDDLDIINPDLLGSCYKSTTSDYETILQVNTDSEEVLDLIESVKTQIKEAKSPGDVIRLERRLSRLSGKVAVVKVGANSEIELKEKSDRVEDAICATKAAIKEGIVSGGGVALLDASNKVKPENKGEELLLEAILAPFKKILSNAGVNIQVSGIEGVGYDVISGEMVNMIEKGIIDPLLVTKSALKNAASVATTILSTDCVINNLRIGDESGR
jgi:chaperonin GroEL